MKKKLQSAVNFAIGVCVLAVIVLFTCVNFGSGPNEKTIYYIDSKDTYYSPPLMERDVRPFAYLMFTNDAIASGFSPLDARIESQTASDGLVYANPRTMKWVIHGDVREYIPVSKVTREELIADYPNRKPDDIHRNDGGFKDWCGPFKWGLRKLGFAKPRFAEDGSWNW